MENSTRSSSSSDTDTVAEDEPSALDVIDLGQPPLLQGEDRQSFEEFYGHFQATIAPVDAIEELFVCDVADETWDILRLRRFKAKLIDARASHGVRQLLKELVEPEVLEGLIAGWVHRKVSSVNRVNRRLARAGFDRETVLAETLAANFREIENLDRSIMQKEAQRNAVYREIERHRESLARRSREAVAEVEESEIADVTAPGARLVTGVRDQTYSGQR